MRKVVYGLILAFGLSMFPGAAAQADTVSDESSFVAKINGLRASKGLSTLAVNENLVAKARAWAAQMAAAGRIWHSTLSDGITADWKKLGENVGMGGSVDGLHAAFVASPHHYENLVDAAFDSVGVGIVMNGSTIYVAQVFMQLMPAAKTVAVVTPPPSAPRVTTTTTTRPVAPKPVAPKPAAPKPAAPKLVVAQTPVAPAAPPAAATPDPTPPPAPEVIPTAPADPPRAPSALLVSVLERLRTFDS
jgi:hypothetical protein